MNARGQGQGQGTSIRRVSVLKKKGYLVRIRKFQAFLKKRSSHIFREVQGVLKLR